MKDDKKQVFPRLMPDESDWPIYKLSQDRSSFVQEINDFTQKKLVSRFKKNLADVLQKTIYLERIRIKEDPWKVDPPNDRVFWNRISKALIKRSLDRDDHEAKAVNEEILGKIIGRYSEEIVGTFNIPTHRFAVRFLTILFNRFLNAALSKSLLSLIFGGKKQIIESLNVKGELETVRALFDQGTVVVVPTHFSNMDSILVGFAMDSVVGLPSFSYGAGLNLYNSGPAAYFMNRLGAYRVDRRKKNTVYLETLKAMSNLSLQRGVNSLFFPGGTRSRSGKLETELKLGLLGTSVEAQRAMCAAGSDKKVFIVPLIISYHFVLEAPFLIEQHLKFTGKEQYLRLKDSGKSIRDWAGFVWRYFGSTSEITLSFGKPMDVLGNFVNEKGVSFDQFNNEISINDYFISEGTITEDRQREEQYTQILADKIVERYHVENIVLSSHLVAFAVFKMLEKSKPDLDLYGLLRLPPDDFVFSKKSVERVVEQMQQQLFKWEKADKIKLSDAVYLPAADLLVDGIKNLGILHTEKPLIFNKVGDIVSNDFKVLFYYHNRMDNYDLEKAVKWKDESIELLSVD